jgi:hypothetical protein
VFDDSENVVVGDGAGNLFYRVPSSFNGYKLKDVEAAVKTAGVTGTTLVQICNVTKNADMLSTRINIDTNEMDSKNAVVQPVIDTDNDVINTGDILRFDVDQTQTGTAPFGLMVEMQFG